jgi:hypothetical protein
MLQGSDLVLEGAEVARFDTPCIEALLAASQTWAATGLDIKTECSEHKLDFVAYLLEMCLLEL